MCEATQTKLAWVGRIADDRWDRATVAHNINCTHHGRGTRRSRRKRTQEPRRLRRMNVAVAADDRVGVEAAATPTAVAAPGTLRPRRKLPFA